LGVGRYDFSIILGGIMTKALYLDDAYLKEFESKVKSVKDGKYVVLEETLFYPNSGGQPFDTGKLTRKSDNKEFNVVFVGKFDGAISHEVAPIDNTYTCNFPRPITYIRFLVKISIETP